MKRLIAALALATCAMPAMADKIPADLHMQPEKFCFVAGVISAGIMERFNVGRPIEYTYAEVNRLDQPELRTYLNESVTLAGQFYRHAGEPVEPKQFAQWNYQRCMSTMKPKPAETYEMVDGKLKKVI